MSKPFILTVDDDPDVLRAVERDLRRQYGSRYRIIAADSGRAALEAVEHLGDRQAIGGDNVAPHTQVACGETRHAAITT